MLPANASALDYAPLIDMVRPGRYLHEHRYLGMTAEVWLSQVRTKGAAEYVRALAWYVARVGHVRRKLDLRPRVPNKRYSVELAAPPVRAMLPYALARLGLRRATADQWLATINGLAAKGVRAEEPRQSGVLQSLADLPGSTVMPLDALLPEIDLSHVLPRLVCESSYGFVTSSGWRECCSKSGSIRRGIRRRGAIGNGRDVLELIRYRHRTFGWSLVRQTRFADLLGDRVDRWEVRDERGKPVHAPSAIAFATAQQAMDAAETAMSERFRAWRKSRDLPLWQDYTLAGGDGYREILVQLDNWPYSYQPRHFRTRDVLIHLRTSLRTSVCGRRLLYLDEVQSDWHADLHALAKNDRRRLKTAPPPAPFAKEWPLLALKLMLWWAQRVGAEGLAWSSAHLQAMIWAGHKPPLGIYERDLPEAATLLARTLAIACRTIQLSVRSAENFVELRENGWLVIGEAGHSLTKPFRTREQAEHFADLITGRALITVPVLMLDGLPTIKVIPLFGVGSREDWVRDIDSSTSSTTTPSVKRRRAHGLT